MIKVNLSNWKTLLEAETPPCITMVIPLENSSELQKKATLIRAQRKAERLLAKDFSQNAAKRMAHIIPDALPKVHKRCKAIAIFVSPELQYYAELDVPTEERVIVANSFHISPLLEGCWHLRGMGVYVSGNEIRLYCSTDAFSKPILQTDISQGKRIISACRGASRVYVGGLEPMNKSFLLRLKEAIPENEWIKEVSEQEFKAELLSLDRKRVIEELRELEALFSKESGNGLQEKSRLARFNLKSRIGKTLFAPLKKRYWGRLNKDTYDFVLNQKKKQAGSQDDCVLDDFLEEGLRKSFRIYLVDPTLWKIKSPFIVV